MVNPCYNTIRGKVVVFPHFQLCREADLRPSAAPWRLSPAASAACGAASCAAAAADAAGGHSTGAADGGALHARSQGDDPQKLGKEISKDITGWWFGTFGLFSISYNGMSSFPTDCRIFQSGRYTTNQNCAEAIQSPALGHSGARLAGMVVHKGNIFNLGLIFLECRIYHMPPIDRAI